MKKPEDILLLGNPLLYKKCHPLLKSELKFLPNWISDLHNVMQAIRFEYNFGRAIAAPQIGLLKRIIYLNIDKPIIIINPELIQLSTEVMEIWDDCMSFPNLLVKVKRHKNLTLRYFDENWEQKEWRVNDDISALLQHEYDHLDGILCTMRAINKKSFKWRQFKS